MTIIFFQENTTLSEYEEIKKEFPQYELLTKVHRKDWEKVEILYGNQLSVKELHLCSRLRWIHSPSPEMESLCLDEVKQKETILVTFSKGENIAQIAEFVIGGILAFAKQFFLWKQVPHDPDEFWDWPLKDTLWTLSGRTLIQIGLGEVGSAIVYRANSLGMRTWGVKQQKTFHPHCQKTFSVDELNSLLPSADVVSMSIPKGGMPKNWFGTQQLDLMKKDSIFVLTGSAESLDEEALIHCARTGKFRGVLLDSFQDPPSKHSLLWKMPGGILTPHIASFPESQEHKSFHDFRQNLRQFVQGKILNMKNLVE